MLSSCTGASNEDVEQGVSESVNDTSGSDDVSESSDTVDDVPDNSDTADDTSGNDDIDDISDSIDMSVETYRLGDTVSTDIAECSLESCQFAIALENTYGEDFFAPKEYNAAEDAKNPYVASIGHTLVSFTIRVKNLNRTSLNIRASIITVIYDGEEYSGNVRLGATSSDNINWTPYSSGNVIISASDIIYIRGYMDIPVEVSDLTESFDVRLALERSDEEKENFIYHVTSDGNE